MSHYDYHFHRKDPTPWIKFDDATVRGDHAVFWVCVAALVFLGMAL